MDCGAAEHFEHSCETDPASWTGKYEFESHTCDPSTCCCPKGIKVQQYEFLNNVGAKITKGDNQTLTVEITCAKYKIKDTQRIENHQIYYTLGNSSGVLIVSAEGVQYINADGACSAFGERKNTATVIVGVIMGLVMFFLLAGIGVFVWYRNRAMLGESAPLRV